MRLTDVSIRKINFTDAGQVRYRDDSVPGFGIAVGKRSKTFFVMRGKERRVTTIGQYPEICLKDARAEAKRLMSGKLEKKSNWSLPDARTAFLDDCRTRLKASTVDRYHYSLVTLKEPTIDKISTKHTDPNMLKALKVFFNWCIDQGLAETNPFIRRKVVFRKRTRLLTDEEVAKIWTYDYPPYSNIVKALLLSGQRRNQVWKYDDAWRKGDTLEFPPWVMKSNRTHILPVAGYVQYLQPTTFHSWSKAKKRMDNELGILPWVLHDLRRYFSTTMAKLKVPLHITEQILDHRGVLGGVAGDYNLYTFLPEMREALLLFERHVTKLVSLGH